MKFVIDGGCLSSGKEPQIVKDAIAFCRVMKDGDLLSIRQLADKLNRSEGTLLKFSAYPSLNKLRVRISNGRVYFCNQRTALEAIKEGL